MTATPANLQPPPAPRLPPLDEAALTAEQKRVYDLIRLGPRGLVEGPLRVWLSSPEFAERAQALGAQCRYHTSLPPRLSELAILTVGAFWRAGFEWCVHAPIAQHAGVAAAAIEAIRRGLPPELPTDQSAVHAFTSELLHQRAVDELTYQRLVAAIGSRGSVELVGIVGYYSLVCMTIQAFQIPLPPGQSEPFGPR